MDALCCMKSQTLAIIIADINDRATLFLNQLWRSICPSNYS